MIKAKTGLTPNILSRIAFCISLGEPEIPNPTTYDEDGQEFNRYTLTGEWDIFYMSLLRERLITDNLDPNLDLLPQFRAHLNRGAILLHRRVRSLSDLYDLLPKNTSLETKKQIDETHD
jgi:DNA sulfur modification protein DndE